MTRRDTPSRKSIQLYLENENENENESEGVRYPWKRLLSDALNGLFAIRRIVLLKSGPTK
jgi:hypothetical protein